MTKNRSPGGQRKSLEERKTMRSLRLSPAAIDALNDLEGTLGIRRSAIIEHAIRQLRKHHRDQADAIGSQPVQVVGEERYITCPFCPETDFDQMGLKMHLTNGWCEAYVAISTTPPRFT